MECGYEILPDSQFIIGGHLLHSYLTDPAIIPIPRAHKDSDPLMAKIIPHFRTFLSFNFFLLLIKREDVLVIFAIS